HDKAPDRPRIEIGPKCDRSVRNIIDVWLLRGKVRIKYTAMPPWRRARTIRLRLRAGNKDGVMPLGPRERLVVDFDKQKMILMDVERMVGKRTIDHRPLFVISGNHVFE